MIDQQLNKLSLTDNSIAIFIDCHEHFLYLLSALNLVLQEFHHLLESYLTTVVDIEVSEGLLKMFLCYFFGKIDCSY